MKFEYSFVLCLPLSPLLVVAGTKQHSADHAPKHLSVVDVRSLHTLILTNAKGMVIEDAQPESHDDGRFHRELQLTEACNATYAALWEDKALNAAFKAYWDNRTATSASLYANEDACVSNDAGDVLTCDFDEPFGGEAEFRSACATAGGEILSSSMDLNCVVTLQGGGTMRFINDLPSFLDCIPSTNFDDCADELKDFFGAIAGSNAADFENNLAVTGVTGVSCNTTDNNAAVQNGGGSSNQQTATSDNGGSSTTGDATIENGGSSQACSTQGYWLWVFSFYFLVRHRI